MDERVVQFRVGVVIVAATIIAAVLVIRFGEGIGIRRPYTIFVQFDKAPGVTVGTPVRKHGVLIGRVNRVDLLDRGVKVTARIEQDYTLRDSDVCRISTASLLGDAILDFVPTGADEAAAEVVQPGEYLKGEAAGNPLEVLVDMQEKMSSAINSIELAGNQVTVLADSLNMLVSDNENQLQRILQKTEQSLDAFTVTMGRINEVAGDPELKERLAKVMQEFPLVFNEARQLVADARGTLQNFDRMSQRAEQNFANLEKLTQPIAEIGPDIVASVGRSADNLDTLLGQLAVFAEGLDAEEGLLGKLSDPQLVTQVERVIDNIEDLTVRLRPIMDDVRIFTDKIARDPRQLGLKGAVDQRPSGAGTKYMPRTLR